MKILALEFSSPQRSVAVVQAEVCPGRETGDARRGQGATVSEVIETGAGGSQALGMIGEALRGGRGAPVSGFIERGAGEFQALGRIVEVWGRGKWSVSRWNVWRSELVRDPTRVFGRRLPWHRAGNWRRGPVVSGCWV